MSYVKIYNPEANVIAEGNFTGSTFKDLQERFGLEPKNFKYVMALEDPTTGGLQHISLDFDTTPIPEEGTVMVFLFAKKNVSGKEDIHTLCEDLGIEPEDLIRVVAYLADSIVEKLESELETTSEKTKLLSVIAEIKAGMKS